MKVTHCPGCHSEHLFVSPSEDPGLWNKFANALLQSHRATCLDRGLISTYAKDDVIPVLRERQGLKPWATGAGDEL